MPIGLRPRGARGAELCCSWGSPEQTEVVLLLVSISFFQILLYSYLLFLGKQSPVVHLSPARFHRDAYLGDEIFSHVLNFLKGGLQYLLVIAFI